MKEWLEKYEYDQTQSVDKEGGSVYRGQDKRSGQPLVIKVQEVHPIWDRGMLQARYQLAMQLKHPHLLPCRLSARGRRRAWRFT